MPSGTDPGKGPEVGVGVAVGEMGVGAAAGAQVLIVFWCKHYNTIRPHSSLGYWLPAPATFIVQTSQIHKVGLTL